MTWQPELDDLERMRALGRRMGGPEGIARQHGRDKLTVRERLDQLLDRGSFEEIKSTYGERTYDEDGRLRSFRPGNNVIGYGRIDGRRVHLRGDDFTIRGGSSDPAGRSKRDIEQAAGHWRVPLVQLLDGAGGSVREVAGGEDVTGSGDMVAEHEAGELGTLVEIAELGVPGSSAVPDRDDPPPAYAGVGPATRYDLASLLAADDVHAQVPVASAVLGSCAGWVAIAAADSHFSVMTRETSELFVAGPPLISQALGIEISKQELGDWRVHAAHTGVVHNVAEDEADALGQVRRFLSYLPSNVWQVPPRTEPRDDPNRRDEELISIIPRDRRRGYHIRRLIDCVVDRDSAFELQALFGRSLVTMFARIDGYPVALIANDVAFDGGAQTAAACQKFERFVDLADTFHLPVVYLCDVPGFMIGPKSELEGTLRWAMHANRAVSEATVPYCTILLRRYYGVAMGGSKRGPGLNPRYAWPSAESGSLPAAGGVMAAYRRTIEAADDPEAMRIEIEERLNALASVMRRPQLADEIIDPRDTRRVLVDFVRRAQEVTATQLGPKLRVGMRP